MPGLGLQVKCANSLFGWHLLRVHKASIWCASDHNHVVLVNCKCSVPLPTSDSLLQAILDLAHFVAHGVEHLHVIEHLVALIEAPVKVDLVLHVRD